MYQLCGKVLVTFFSLAVIGCGFSGCATRAARVVTPGIHALVQYTCYLKSGEIVATTSKEVAQDNSLRKSSLFSPTERYAPLALVAGAESNCLDCDDTKGFSGIIAAQMAQKIVGQSVGVLTTVELTAGVPSDLMPNERFVQLARIKWRPKEIRLTRDIYTRQTGKAPEVGQEVSSDPAISGKVTSITETEVTVRFWAQENAKVDTPFGKGRIRDAGDHFEVVIDAQVGHLVRSGPLVGRIIDVNERYFTLDYGHPFGGETLVCDVTVESVEEDIGGSP